VKRAALIAAALTVALLAPLLRGEHTTAPVTAAVTTEPLPPVGLPSPSRFGPHRPGRSAGRTQGAW
jgi:hypothetical protein